MSDNDRIKKAIVSKLTEMDKLDDGELPDYILVMVNNRRDKRDMEHDLNLFLGDDTQKFINWLFDFTRRGSRRGFREEGEVSPDRERSSRNCPAIGNPGLRKLVENYDKDIGDDVEDVKKWEKIEGEDDELMIKGSDEEDEDWKKRKDRKRALSPGERRAIEKMNASAIARQKAGTDGYEKSILVILTNIKYTFIMREHYSSTRTMPNCFSRLFSSVSSNQCVQKFHFFLKTTPLYLFVEIFLRFFYLFLTVFHSQRSPL